MDDNWKKELTALIRKHRLLPEKFTGQVVLVFNQGGIRNALMGPKPQPLIKNQEAMIPGA